jgi:hypothetical protein
LFPTNDFLFFSLEFGCFPRQGNTSPQDLFALLPSRIASLPAGCAIWISNQGFNQSDLEAFYDLAAMTPWLEGVVYGPHTRDSIATVRQRLPEHVPIRLYPDVCHGLKAQFPQPGWVAQFAFTEGREVVNPRGVQMQNIFQLFMPFVSVGFSTYSDGSTDDVNMQLWGYLGLHGKVDVLSFYEGYARTLLQEYDAVAVAEAMAALEFNWINASQAQILSTLQLFQELVPSTTQNWRMQSFLYRAYYDAFQNERYLAAQRGNDMALATLREAGSLGSVTAMQTAVGYVNASFTSPYYQIIFDLGDQLFHSIGLQLSVKLYHAASLGRGASLDSIYTPLNDVRYLTSQFETIARLPSEGNRVAALVALANERVVPAGSFYDSLGNINAQPHLLPGQGVSTDPSFYASSLSSFHTPFDTEPTRCTPILPWTWYTWAESFYDTPLQMKYTELLPTGQYRLKVVFGQLDMEARVRLVANGNYLVHDYVKKTTLVVVDLPPALTASGTLTLSWNQPPGAGGNGRGCQVSEVFLLLMQNGTTYSS